MNKFVKMFKYLMKLSKLKYIFYKLIFYLKNNI